MQRKTNPGRRHVALARSGTVGPMAWLGAFGDSIVWGSWDEDGGGWAQRLARTANRLCDRGLTEKRVHSLGVPGDRLADVLARFHGEADARDIEHVVIAIGLNDAPHLDDTGAAVPGTDPHTFRLQYDALLEKAFRFTQDVVLLGLTNVDEGLAHGWSNASIGHYDALVRSIAERHGLPFLDPFGSLDATDLQIDGVHPGPSGHRKLHDLVADRVLPQWRTM